LRGVCAAALTLPIVAMLALLLALVVMALPQLLAQPSELLASLLITLAIAGLTAILAIPTGIGAAIYVEEYGAGDRLGAWIEWSIAQLERLPPVVYGVVGAQLFVVVVGFGFGFGLAPLVCALTLTLMVLPMITDGARAALRHVPTNLREAGVALGASRWQVIRRVVLPHALPTMLAASLRALGRAIGDATPVVVMGMGALRGVEVIRGDVAPGSEQPVPLALLAFESAHAPDDMPAGPVILLLLLTLTLSTFAALRGTRHTHTPIQELRR
jgi:phosphate transport system permease protein